MTRSLEDVITAEYGRLSERLRAAADFVLAHPADVATRSLRSVAGRSGLAPATFSRLARALGYGDYEALREDSRHFLRRRIDNFEARAERLQSEIGQGTGLLGRQAAASIANISGLVDRLDAERLELVASKLHNAPQVMLLAALSSRGLADYMAYVANYLSSKWSVAGAAGNDWPGLLTRLTPEDAVLAITMQPFASQTLDAVAYAKRRGAFVALITDDPTCPAIQSADCVMMVASDSPQFFSGYAATLVLCETLLGMLAARGGEGARSRIAEVEACSRRLGMVRDGV